MNTRYLALAILLSIPAARAADAIAIPKTVAAQQPVQPAFTMEDSGCGGEGNLADVQCLGNYLRWLDGELNLVYRRALKKLPEKDMNDNRREREQLRKSQRAWLKYKTDNCTLVGALEGGSNLWVTHFAALCEERELKDRIKFLKDIATDE